MRPKNKACNRSESAATVALLDLGREPMPLELALSGGAKRPY